VSVIRLDGLGVDVEFAFKCFLRERLPLFGRKVGKCGVQKIARL
jgi:hypothetical protein